MDPRTQVMQPSLGNYMAPPPQKFEWAPPVDPVPGCPPGLEYMVMLDQLLVHQQIELFEVATGMETPNRYAIKNKSGQQCYYAYEESEACQRLCCGPKRAFVMHIVDNAGKEVMSVIRDTQACSGCCWCAGSCESCSYKVEVQCPPGTPVATFRQIGSCFAGRWEVIDNNNDRIMIVDAPVCVCSNICCRSDIEFPIHPSKGTKSIGCFKKHWAGVNQEFFTSATNFSLTFPRDLEVKMKCALLGGLFLIDMMFFERNNAGAS